ncbi:NAD(P)H-dependent amine dehydrogenase family protein [Mycobacterium sp.]|uniref:NAD(P)H-dependent amine dehydrogenase family protein n=1 Tax=Mycobacterium sp. TaxID=1785 RepID=UPI003D0C6420
MLQPNPFHPGKIRVAHVGTGATGSEALKAILDHPDLELVTLWTTTPEKTGRDAGELVGRDPVGISAVGSLEAALAHHPDVLSYCGNGLGRIEEVVQELTVALDRGVNVATISLLGMLYPAAAPVQHTRPLHQAALAGAASSVSTGLDPGFSSDVLPLALLTMADTIEHVHIQEIGVYDHYDVEPVLRGIMGFGQSPDYDAPIATGGDFVRQWRGLVQQLADRMELALDEIVGTSDYAVHDADLQTSVGLMARGTVVARRVACHGLVGGKPTITAEHVTRMKSHVAPHWPTFDGVGESNYRVVITGNPNIRCDLDLGKSAGVWGSVKATAMRVVNLIPALVAAPPGLHSALDFPLVPGRRVLCETGS